MVSKTLLSLSTSRINPVTQATGNLLDAERVGLIGVLSTLLVICLLALFGTIRYFLKKEESHAKSFKEQLEESRENLKDMFEVTARTTADIHTLNSTIKTNREAIMSEIRIMRTELNNLRGNTTPPEK